MKKTIITRIEDGFDFLGQNVRKYNGHCIIKPSKKNVKTFLANVREVIKGNKTATAYALVTMLNPKIRGWANFHCHSAAKETFAHVDTLIHKASWQWAKRRHPKKTKDWIAEKYFGTTGNRNWRFFDETRDKDGKMMRNWLCLAASTPVTRYTKLKGDCNPYDPDWELYLEQRLGVKMEATLRGRSRLSYLWKEQKGICPVCEDLVTKLTGWHNHQIVYRVHGGSDLSENRVLVHPDCHRQIHSKGLSVTKPRPSQGVIQA